MAWPLRRRSFGVDGGRIALIASPSIIDGQGKKIGGEGGGEGKNSKKKRKIGRKREKSAGFI